MILKELTNDEFNAFTKNNYTSLYQSSNYALTMTKQGFECYYYGIIDNNTLVAITLLIAESNQKEKEVLIDLILNFLSNK